MGGTGSQEMNKIMHLVKFKPLVNDVSLQVLFGSRGLFRVLSLLLSWPGKP